MLANSSDFFYALFAARWTNHGNETFYEGLPEYTIGGVGCEELFKFAEHIYTGRTIITGDNVQNLLVVADYFCNDRLVEECCRFIMKNLAPSNCVNAWLMARVYRLKSLEEEVRRFLVRRYDQVMEEGHDEVAELQAGDLIAILTDDQLMVENESAVWSCAVSWLNHRHCRHGDLTDELVTEIIKSVRLGSLEQSSEGPNFLADVVGNHKLVASNMALRSHLQKYQECLRDGTHVYEKMFCARYPSHVVLVFGGYSGWHRTNVVQVFNPRTEVWTEHPEEFMDLPRVCHSAETVGDNCYIIGGTNMPDFTHHCRVFDAGSRRWKKMAKMHSKRCYVSVAKVGAIIYAIGGHDGFRGLKTIEKYDPQSDQWSLMAPMNHVRTEASAAVVDDLVYVTGGFDGEQCLNSVEVYDPKIDTWRELPTTMAVRKSGVVTVQHNGYLYILGGSDGISRLNNVERFCTRSYSWSTMAPMLKRRSNFAAVVLGHKIYVFGGYDGVTTIPDVEYYDTVNNTWHRTTSMITHRFALCACLVDNMDAIASYV